MNYVKIKQILLLISAVILLPAVGCIFPGRRGGGGYRDQGEDRGHVEYPEHSEYRGSAGPSVDVGVHAAR